MKTKPKLKLFKALRGFSLLELMVVMVLVALLVSITVPSLLSMGTANVRKSAMQIGGAMSEVYDRAALVGKTQRMVFDLDQKQFWVEEKEGEAGDVMPELGYEAERKSAFKENKFEPKFKKVEGELGEPTKLSNDVIYYNVWAEGMDEPATKEQVHVYFFPGGFAQKAFVTIGFAEDKESLMAVSMSPLTGEISITPGEPDLQKIKDEQKNDQ